MTNNIYEESKKGVMEIKKFLILLLVIIMSINIVKAEEKSKEYPEVTNDIEFRYKWYKEIISRTGEYYPAKDITKKDKVDENNIKYIGGNIYNPKYCDLPSEYYLKDQKYVREYKRIYSASYVLIENISNNTDIKIYSNNKLIKYDIISSENNQIKINLKNEYLCENLLFYIDTTEKYKITIYNDSLFKREIISKEFDNEKIVIPDKTWITEKTQFYYDITSVKHTESDFIKLVSENLSCSYKEKYIYKYDVTKEYYDNNYHSYVDGYIKDETDYRLFYKGEPITITNTIEVVKEKEVIKEKIVKEPKIEYIYIEKENDKNENDSSKKAECLNQSIIEPKTEIKKQIIEKEIFKIPKRIYFVIAFLITIIILLILKLIRKKVE